MGRAVKPTAEYEEKPPERIPEPEKRALAGEAAGERFEPEERLQAEWKSMRRLRIQGSAGLLGRSEPHSGTGAWEEFGDLSERSDTRGDLNPPPRQTTPPEPRIGGGRERGGGWDTEAPRSAQDAPGLEGPHRWVGRTRAAGAPEPGSAAVERSSWPLLLVPPRFFFKHWLLSLAGAEPGS